MIAEIDNFDPGLTTATLCAKATGTATATPGPGLSFCIPEEDTQFWTTRVPHDEQQRIRKLLAVFAEIYHAGKGKQDPALDRLARALTTSRHTLRRLYYDYKGGCERAGRTLDPGDWRSILNWSKVRDEKQNVPPAFQEFWRGLGESNQRNWKAAHRELLQIHRTGFNFQGRSYKLIPGYTEWPPADPYYGWPAGWSYENLIRFKSIDLDTIGSRLGRSAASAHRLPALTSRVGLALGQFIQFDDHVFNQKILFQTKPMRPLAFGAVDVLSDCLFHLGCKPTLYDETLGVKLELTEKEFLWFFIAELCGYGYRRDAIGTTMVLEGAKATIREPFLSRFKAVLGDFVKFDFGSPAGNNTRAAHAGQFSGRPKGNFRTKAIVESKWNMVDNEMASLLGQVGKDRDHSPAQLHGQEKYIGQLVRAADKAGVALSELQFPVHRYADWCQCARAAQLRINDARDHACAGWEKLGFERLQWRTDVASPLWYEIADLAVLPPVDQQVIKARLSGPQSADLTRPLRLSRWEVFQQRRKELTQMPMHRIPEILGVEFALSGGQLMEVGSQQGGLFSFDCEEIDPDTLHFYARDIKAEASHIIPNGRKFICFVNPYLPSHLIACDEKLRVVALCPRFIPPTTGDRAGLKPILGAINAQGEASRVRLNLRHDDESRRKRAMKEHNAQALGLAPRAPSPAPALAVNPTADDILARDAGTVPQDEETW